MEFNQLNYDLIPSISYLCECIIIVFDKTKYQTFLIAKKILSYLRKNEKDNENNNYDYNNIILVSTFNDVVKNGIEGSEIDENEINDLINNIYSLTGSSLTNSLSGIIFEKSPIPVEYISVSNITKNNIIKLKNMIMKIYNPNKNLSNSNLQLNNNLDNEKSIFPKKIIHPLKNTKESGYNSFKIILLGDSTVGKSAFFNRFFKNDFQTNFMSTFGIVELSKNIVIYENIYKIQLWDTAGQERFRSIPQKYFEKADGIILIYDITNEETFDNIISWVNDIKKSRNENVIIYLIGNKVDLIEERKISNESGKEIAIDQNMKFIEISVKWDLNVSDVVYNLVFDIYNLNYIRDNDFIKIKNEQYSKSTSCCY